MRSRTESSPLQAATARFDHFLDHVLTLFVSSFSKHFLNAVPLPISLVYVTQGVADLHLASGDDSGLDIPAAPRPALTSTPSANYVSSPSGSSAASPVPPPFKAYVPQPTAHAPPVPVASNLGQYYAQSPPPSFVRPPINNTDPRVQDTVELCNFAILALKVSSCICFERLYILARMSLIRVSLARH